MHDGDFIPPLLFGTIGISSRVTNASRGLHHVSYDLGVSAAFASDGDECLSLIIHISIVFLLHEWI